MKLKLSSNKLEVRKSKLSGLGLFASQDFKKGQRLFIVKGKPRTATYTLAETKTFPNDIAVGFEKWITPSEDNPWRYINHSCSANVGIKGRVTVFATMAIKAGEELLIDYASIEANPYWVFKNCKCGSSKCRKVIYSFPKSDPKLQKSLLAAAPSFIHRIYAKNLK